MQNSALSKQSSISISASTSNSASITLGQLLSALVAPNPAQIAGEGWINEEATADLAGLEKRLALSQWD